MIDPATQQKLKQAIAECIEADKGVLDQLRSEIGPLKDVVKRIQPRTTTSISLVATDGGNNQLQFDPFLVQVVRVVDSSNNEYCLEAVSPTSPIDALSRRQFNADGSAATPLGEMMLYLGVSELPKLSHMIRPRDGEPMSPSWVQVYRELMEWAVLFSILRKDFGTDTLIVCDGLLRSKVFAGELFPKLLKGMKERIDMHREKHRRNVYIVGVAKHSKVLTRYELAMSLEGVLRTDYPAYLELPREIEAKAYKWSEFARGAEQDEEEGEANKFVGGKMFMTKFGSSRHDPIWPVDVFEPQVAEAQMILGAMLADAIVGFPVPFYPRCLQKAHENAALVDFDYSIVQDHIYEGVRATLGAKGHSLDAFRLRDTDPAAKRYG